MDDSMISRWKLLNFKAVKKSVDLPFTNLTLFAGANSSGKSTLLQSILLISQTLGSKISSRSVVLNGELAKLGQFDDLRSLPRRADTILVGWECTPLHSEHSASESENALENEAISWYRGRYSSFSKVGCEIRFGVEESAGGFAQLHPILFECKVSVERESKESFLRLRRRHNSQAKDKQEQNPTEWVPSAFASTRVPNRDYEAIVDDETVKEIKERLGDVELVGCSMQHFLPAALWYGLDEVTHVQKLLTGARGSWSDASRVSLFDLSPELLAVLDGIIKKLDLNLSLGDTSKAMPLSFWQGLLEPLPREDLAKLITAIKAEADPLRHAILAGKSSSYSMRENLLKLDSQIAAQYFDYFFASQIFYLGPLRDEPKALYPLATTASPLDIGLRGEHTAAILELHRQREIAYFPSGCFVDPDIRNEPETVPLLDAVIDWLQYMDVASGVRTEDKGKLGYELKIMQSSDNAHDLTHVGVGVSQVLPIIVLCLLAPKGSVLIFEQPELHLHPKVQTLLGDFFLSIAQLGKQCILETHSEYLINRLRYRAACAAGDSLSKLLKIYFVEQREGTANYREVKVNKFGAIVDWPEGFFDQSQRETENILSAASLKFEVEGKE